MSAIITEDINLCATVLRDGGVVICPTEGVYGLSCAVFSDDAVKRIISIKNRDSAKGLIIVSDSEKRLDNILDKELLSVDDKALLSKYWPGPHTFIVKCKDNFESPALRKDHSVALRVTAFEGFKRLCALTGVPLISTSSNFSGLPSSTLVEELDKKLIDMVDLVLTLPCQGQKVSTSIYDTLNHKLLRAGPNFKE